jgi:hypothetical protein
MADANAAVSEITRHCSDRLNKNFVYRGQAKVAQLNVHSIGYEDPAGKACIGYAVETDQGMIPLRQHSRTSFPTICQRSAKVVCRTWPLAPVATGTFAKELL